MINRKTTALRGLGQITAKLSDMRRQWENTMENGVSAGASAPPGDSRLVEVTGFGSNPGALRMFVNAPRDLPANPALVVVLHGCTQTAAGYDHGAGWSTLAERYGFVLLAPEQQRANNPKTCFTWFQPGDTTRDQGEALSIRQMVERAVRDHGVDPRRIFITGLSAGGAMTSVMLAAYPEVFAAGAIVAGLPYGAAANVQEAFEAMFAGKTRPAREWGDLVRAASPHRGPWPRVSVWHGGADTTVTPGNAQEIVKQWADVHGLPPAATEERRVDGYPLKVWRGADGQALIEEYTIPGMAHGTPLATEAGEVPHGAAGPFLLEVGIASSYHIAAFWGLTADGPRKAEPAAARPARPVQEPAKKLAQERAQEPAPEAPRGAQPGADTFWPKPPGRTGGRGLPIDVEDVIGKALRAAGLMRR